MGWFAETPEGVVVNVKAQPRSSRAGVDGLVGDAVKVLETRPDNVTRLEFRLHEGRKRQIRYMCSAAHLVVLSLVRVAIGGLRLPADLRPGEWRDLSAEEIRRALSTPPATEAD